MAPDDLLDLIRRAFVAGCEAVQENYRPDPDPEFGEAALDYAASLDFTEITRPVWGASAEPPHGQWVRRWCDYQLRYLKHRQTGQDPKANGYAYAEVADWSLRQLRALFEPNTVAGSQTPVTSDGEVSKAAKPLQTTEPKGDSDALS